MKDRMDTPTPGDRAGADEPTVRPVPPTYSVLEQMGFLTPSISLQGTGDPPHGTYTFTRPFQPSKRRGKR